MLQAIPGCVGWLAGVEPISLKVLDAAKTLRVISRNGTGVDNIDVTEAEARGIAVQRAIGANAVLAGAGAPVCCEQLTLPPVRVHTCMRVDDSLAEGVSLFMAELLRIKEVVEASGAAATSGRPVLYLLDEILHGTNSRERQIGARWLLAELLKRGAVGAVSTHDEELCRLTPELMSKVTLVHFRETVENGKMTFDYRLREGPVKAGNALRVMQLAGLDVPLS